MSTSVVYSVLKKGVKYVFIWNIFFFSIDPSLSPWDRKVYDTSKGRHFQFYEM